MSMCSSGPYGIGMSTGPAWHRLLLSGHVQVLASVFLRPGAVHASEVQARPGAAKAPVVQHCPYAAQAHVV